MHRLAVVEFTIMDIKESVSLFDFSTAEQEVEKLPSLFPLTVHVSLSKLVHVTLTRTCPCMKIYRIIEFFFSFPLPKNYK